MLYQVGAMLGCPAQALDWIASPQRALAAMQAQASSWVQSGKRLPRVYFEEWDEPHISAFHWVSELMGMAGGVDVFPELAREPSGKNRIIERGQRIIDQAPDVILGSWCGRKLRPERVAARPGWADVPAVQTGHLYEIKSADICQPGPAALTDGVAQMHKIFTAWVKQHG